jgi:predicted transcriptional regulator
MRLLIDISINLYNKIKSSIEVGKYPSYSDFFAISAENQLMLEKNLSNIPFDKIVPQSKEISKTETLDNVEKKLLMIFKKEAVKTAETPMLSQLLYPGLKSENELYLWGQINRILPIKLGLRVLSNMLIEKNSGYIDLEEYRKTTAKIAQSLRQILEEKTLSISGKKDALWIGLPEAKSDKADKSIDRFKNQFLGYLRKDNVIEGALGRLKFANIWFTENKRICIGITNSGLEFAILENPVLDKNVYDLGSLSDAEKDYYIKHITANIPNEKKMFIDILKLIKEGTSDLTSLNEKLSNIWPNTWTPAVVNTYRSGTTARLVELGLVEKVKKGIEVEYIITKAGKDFLDKTDNIRR